MQSRKGVSEMPVTPKHNEERINNVTFAWEQLAPGESFAGMTLLQFKNRVKASLDARTSIRSLEGQLASAQNDRADADAESNRVIALVVHAVKGNPDHGEDSALYEAMGYVRKSERRSGLRRAAPSPVAS